MTPSLNHLIVDATRAHAEGRLDDAENLARRILAAHPGHAEGLLVLGIVGIKRNDPGLALPNLSAALDADPSSFDAALSLSIMLRRMGRRDEALDAARKAAELRQNEHTLNHLGLCLVDAGFCEEATGAFEQAFELAPNFGPAYEGLGRALQGLGKNTDAIAAFRRGLEIGPVRPAALYQLGDAYMMEPDPASAAECAAAILRMDSNSVPGHILMARARIGDGDVARGAEYAQKALELTPRNAVAAAYYGRALQSLGRIEEADEQFRESIAFAPQQGFAYYSLVHNHKIKEEERPMVARMKELVRESSLPPREMIQLEYGLGKALEDLGEYEEAMRHFDEANRIDTQLKVGVPPFQKHELENTANVLIRTFNPAFFERYRPVGRDSDLPIFVVGMMRSGTTLAEQILSSHPRVGGAGEQLFWPERAGSGSDLFWSDPKGELPSSLNVDLLSTLAEEYLALLAGIAPEKERVVDKMNTNYLLLGLLHLAFPNARIVHMMRNPVDTCLSIWATPVAKDINLCASKDNIVFAYRQYLRVMDHWRSALPADRLLNVQYEELVSDRERVTREMISFCGLEWDEACMAPEKNTRSVKTPSVWQVRQPVYKTSVARWKNYEPWLGDFKELL